MVLLSMAFVAVTLMAATGAMAQESPPTAFGAPSERQAAPPAFNAPEAAAPQAAPLQAKGLLGGLLSWIAQTQQKLQRELAGAVKRLKDGNALAAGLFLAGLSFVYGIVHAAGPGHGKAIISSYVLANEETVRRGIYISFLAAALQGVTAVVLVSILVVALNSTGFQVTAWVNQLETASYALIALVGLYLLATEIRRLWRRRRGDAAHGHGPHHHHHDHDHGHHSHDHAHDHDHEDCEACNHMVDARELTGPFSWKKIAAVVFSVGIRPCSGAVLVLIFALAQGLFWAGVAATFAMAFGTAITVSVLATMALGSRELAIRFGGGNARWADAVWTVCAIGGALLVFTIGVLLFAASLGPSRPF